MKLKILVKIVEKLLGMENGDGAPRADMYLPERLLAMALVLLAGGTAFAVFAVVRAVMWAIAIGIALVKQSKHNGGYHEEGPVVVDEIE